MKVEREFPVPKGRQHRQAQSILSPVSKPCFSWLNTIFVDISSIQWFMKHTVNTSFFTLICNTLHNYGLVNINLLA